MATIANMARTYETDLTRPQRAKRRKDAKGRAQSWSNRRRGNEKMRLSRSPPYTLPSK
jgi:hypothetical protein